MYPANQRANDPYYCAGPAFRRGRNITPIQVQQRVCYPELGTRFVCVACQKEFSNLETHQRKSCGDYNALVRIHNGYIDQFHTGTGPPALREPYHIPGAVYHLVKTTYNLMPVDILGYTGAWGPYDPIPWRGDPLNRPQWSLNVDPQGRNLTSYDELVKQVEGAYPVTFTRPLSMDHRMRGVVRALTNIHHHSILHEMHTEDEKLQMQHVQTFMDAHAQNITFDIEMNPNVPVNNWAHTFIHRSVHHATAAQVAANPSIWVALAPQGEGAAGQGEHGIEMSIVNHANRVANHPTNVRGANNLYEGIPIGQSRRGLFRLPGNPPR